MAGTVLGLKSNTVGGVVTAADTLMTIVPDNAVVEVEAQLPNKDVGFVREGQSVEVKLETYTFTRFGTVPGVVRKLGRDAVKQVERRSNNKTVAAVHCPAPVTIACPSSGFAGGEAHARVGT